MGAELVAQAADLDHGLAVGLGTGRSPASEPTREEDREERVGEDDGEDRGHHGGGGHPPQGFRVAADLHPGLAADDPDEEGEERRLERPTARW